MDYNFNVGDRVITVFGETGVIVDICNCSSCINRGYREPIWMRDDGAMEYITITEMELDFHNFYQIGEYRFAEFDEEFVRKEILYHEDELRKLQNQMRTIITTNLIERGHGDETNN